MKVTNIIKEEVSGFVNEMMESDFKTSHDHFREINQMKHARAKENAYTDIELREISQIEVNLEKLGLKKGEDYKIELPQDQMGTKIPRFEFRFYRNDIDNILSKSNLEVSNPNVGSQVHGYILRNLRIKR